MSENTWSAVDDYLSDVLLGTDPVLDATVARADAAGLPSIQVSATQGKQLMLLARAIGARRVLEVGHARRIQRHLAGSRAACRRTPRHLRDRPDPRRDGAGEPGRGRAWPIA